LAFAAAVGWPCAFLVFHASGNDNDSDNQAQLLWPGFSFMVEMVYPLLFHHGITSADDGRLQSSDKRGRIQVGTGPSGKAITPH